jgi:hypothetical protein
MPKVRFAGRIFPQAVQLSVKDHPQINWKDVENDLDITFTISVQNGEVTVDCDLNKFDSALHLTSVYMRAFDLARATVDLTAFCSGYGFTVLFEKYTSPEGDTSDFAPHDARLAPLCTAYNMGVSPLSMDENDFHKVLVIVSADWRIFHALRDLIEAITLPHESATNCARAIEKLRHVIAPNQPRGQAWRTLRNALNISEPYLKLITDISTGPRHGDPTHIPGKIAVEVSRRAWIIMNRFFEYKKRNAGSLPVSDFPLLTV